MIVCIAADLIGHWEGYRYVQSDGVAMKMDIINPADWPQWDDLVLATNGYSFFHSVSWAKVLSSSYHYKPTYFTLSEKGKLRALIPIMEVRSLLTGTRGVSLTFTDYCEPIVEDPAIFPDLFDQIIDFGRKSGWKYIELRGGQEFLPYAPASDRYLGHTLQLCADERELFARFSGSTRRGIKKAIQEGVETEVCTTLQSVREFYELHCMTRKRHGVPPQPFHFFRNIYDFIISQNHGFVLLASHHGENIAGAVYFHFGNRALYKYGASNMDQQHLRANNLVMWEAVRWYSLNGYASFCFGRTDCNNIGLRQFKNGWGASERTISYYKYDIEQEEFISNDPDKKTIEKLLLKNLPNSILKGIGHMFYKHMG